MHFTGKNLLETLTYWAPINGANKTNEFGFVNTHVGVLIKGRWEDKHENIRKNTGDEIVSISRVYVDTPVMVDGFIMRGDFAGQALNAEAQQIHSYHETPDLRNLGWERRAYL